MHHTRTILLQTHICTSVVWLKIYVQGYNNNTALDFWTADTSHRVGMLANILNTAMHEDCQKVSRFRYVAFEHNQIVSISCEVVQRTRLYKE